MFQGARTRGLSSDGHEIAMLPVIDTLDCTVYEGVAKSEVKNAAWAGLVRKNSARRDTTEDPVISSRD